MKDYLDHLLDDEGYEDEIEYGIFDWLTGSKSKADPQADLITFIEHADKKSRDAILNAFRILVQRWKNKSGSLSLAKIALGRAEGFITVAIVSNSGQSAAKNVGLALDAIGSLKSIAITGASIGAALTLPSLIGGLFGIASSAASLAQAATQGARAISAIQTIYNTINVVNNISSNAARLAKIREASELLESIDTDLLQDLEGSSKEFESGMLLDELMDEVEEEEASIPAALSAVIQTAKGLLPAFGRPRVVFVPGVMGSALAERGGQTLWSPPVARLASLVAKGNGIDNDGNVYAPGFIKVPPSYAQIGALLTAVSDFLPFPYDWRLSIKVNASRLKQAILRKWPDARTKKVTVIAHSMGGLVARAFVESSQINGHELVHKLIAGGSPHLGAPQAYTYLNGTETVLKGFVQETLIPKAQQTLLINAVVSTMQVLPIYDFVKTGGKLESRKKSYAALNQLFFDTSNPKFPNTNLKGEMQRRKLDINKVLTDFRRNTKNSVSSLDSWLKKVGVKYHLIGSTGLGTASSWNKDTNSLVKSNKGDSTVPLFSALMETYNAPAPTQITRKTVQEVVHQSLFNSLTVQKSVLKQLFPSLPISGELEFMDEYEPEFY